MSTITRRLPNSIITLKKAINKGQLMNSSLPAAERFLPPAFETDLNNGNTELNNAYNAEAVAAANYNINNQLLRTETERMRKYTSHFIQVLNLAIDRGDDNFVPGDRSYYQLPDATVPNMDTEENAFLWAANIIQGEANRMVKPGAVAMSNPSVIKIQTIKTTADGYLAQENVLATALTNARANLNNYLEPGKTFIPKLWNYVETHYLELPDETRRNILREWGVVYISEGEPATLTGTVRTATGAPLSGATVTIEETGATTTTNADGRYNLPTTFIGTGSVLFTFPGLPNANLPFTTGTETEGQTIDMPEVVMG